MNRAAHVKRIFRILALLSLCALFAWGGYNRIYEALSLYREARARDEKLGALEEHRLALEEELRKMGNLSAIEEEAKERFNLKFPGEKVVVVLPEEAPREQERPSESWVAREIRKVLEFFIE